ncbi:uncharacterized protein LOC117332896 [Pecten maximus]|uniref:uncharacterized protein LOC117332896 n=1 Tax=Pecten maximus TaxID=6579 RepID=UPI0014581F7F|nr:uncharacterized protein LOC117332896 [Pecten maximus]
MHRYFTYNTTYHYLDVLQDIVRNYNARSHSALDGKSPDAIKKSNQAIVWKHLYVDTKKPKATRRKHPPKPVKFKIGDAVRISSTRHMFQRDYEKKWTEEVFTIKARYLRKSIPVYKIVDYDGDSIKGTFYNSELQKVNKGRDGLFKVEKVLKRRKRSGVKEVDVKWLGYPKKFNSWIKESDLEDI